MSIGGLDTRVYGKYNISLWYVVWQRLLYVTCYIVGVWVSVGVGARIIAPVGVSALSSSLCKFSLL